MTLVKPLSRRKKTAWFENGHLSGGGRTEIKKG